MKKISLLLGSIVSLCLSGLASYAADPDNGVCTVIEQELAQSSYNVLVFEDQDGALSPFLQESMQDTQKIYPDELGKANFNFFTITSSEEIDEYAAGEDATFYVCANSSSNFCNKISPKAMTLNTEWSEISSEEQVRSNAAGHIARASVYMIQQFEAGKAQNGVAEPALLPKMHLLSE